VQRLIYSSPSAKRLRQAASGRAAPNRVDVLRSGDLELDLVRRTVARSGKDLRSVPERISTARIATSFDNLRDDFPDQAFNGKIMSEMLPRNSYERET